MEIMVNNIKKTEKCKMCEYAIEVSRLNSVQYACKLEKEPNTCNVDVIWNLEMKNIESEFSEIVNNNFWELI